MDSIITKQKRPPWHYSTISRLTRYKGNQDRITYLLRELSMMGVKTTQVCSDMPHGSGVSDSTGDLASKIYDKKKLLVELQNENELIDLAVGMLPDAKKLIIDTKYLQENKDDYAQRVLRKNHGLRSRDSYYRLKDEAVEELAKTMGEKC